MKIKFVRKFQVHPGIPHVHSMEPVFGFVISFGWILILTLGLSTFGQNKYCTHSYPGNTACVINRTAISNSKSHIQALLPCSDFENFNLDSNHSHLEIFCMTSRFFCEIWKCNSLGPTFLHGSSRLEFSDCLKWWLPLMLPTPLAMWLCRPLFWRNLFSNSLHLGRSYDLFWSIKCSKMRPCLHPVSLLKFCHCQLNKPNWLWEDGRPSGGESSCPSLDQRAPSQPTTNWPKTGGRTQ